jgi:hypothetical protein
MAQSTGKHQALLIVLLVALSVLNGCGGDVSNTGGGGTIPGAPTGLTITVNKIDATHGTVTLHWNAAANAATYRVRYDYTSGLTKTTGISYGTIITGTSFTTPVYLINSTFYYIVTGVSSGGIEGPASAEISARIAAPSQPATVMAVASSGTNTPQVTVNWTAVNEAATYNIYKDTSPTVTTTPTMTGIAGTAFWDNDSLSNGTTYYYVVKGVNSFGLGPASLVTSATPTSSTLTTVTVSGKVTYEDKEYDRTVGFTGVTAFKAVRFANVELVNASGTPILQAGRTSSDGSYSFSVPSTNIGTTMYVRVISSATPTGTQHMNVKDWGTNLFAVKTSNFTLSGNTSIDLSIPVTSQADGAFNILDVMTSGFQFINAFADPSATTLTNLSLNAFWQNDVSNGTYYCNQTDPTYCPGGTGIYVLSDPFGSGDTDEFDDDVLFHEFGHFTAANFSRDDSMGGPHYLNENDYDMRLTWSEGWGNFFQGAVKHWLSSNDPSLISSKTGVPLSQYVDNVVVGQPFLIVDVAAPEGPGSPYCYGSCYFSTNEISVANVLWNSMTSYDMQNVWNVITGFKASSNVVNLEAFYDGWRILYGDPSSSIYTSRSIYYSNDGYEPDDAFASAQTVTVGIPQQRTLYSSASATGFDADYIKFSATASTVYTITTDTLLNGADTYLTLYDQDGTTEILTSITRDNTSGTTWVAGDGQSNCTYPQNYDCYNYYNGIGWVWQGVPNNATNLASGISWSPIASGTYYLKISPSSARPKSAGKYGSYTLSITNP